jgi:hypothetical protein
MVLRALSEESNRNRSNNMNATTHNPFAGIKDADPNGPGGVYLVPGQYILQVLRCTYKSAAQTFKKVGAFIVEFEVQSSSVAERPQGTVVSYVLKENSPYYFPNMKQLLMAVFNTDDPADIDDELVLTVTDPKLQAAQGKLVQAIATNTTTQKGSDFTKVFFKAEHQPKIKGSAASA